MQVLVLTIVTIIYLIGLVFTWMIDLGLDKRMSGITHWVIMFFIWVSSPVLIFLILKERLSHKK